MSLSGSPNHMSWESSNWWLWFFEPSVTDLIEHFSFVLYVVSCTENHLFTVKKFPALKRRSKMFPLWVGAGTGLYEYRHRDKMMSTVRRKRSPWHDYIYLATESTTAMTSHHIHLTVATAAQGVSAHQARSSRRIKLAPNGYGDGENTGVNWLQRRCRSC